VESYKSDICRFRAMTLSLLHLVVNLTVFTIYKDIISSVYTGLIFFNF